MKTSLWLLISVGLAAVDQVSKFIFQGFFPELVYHNYGSAFSLPLPQLPVIFISFVIMYVAMDLQRREGRWYLWAFLFAGAFGNLIDRLAYGYVIDFINLGFWPVFNIADTYLCLAGFLLVWIYVIKVKTKA